MRTPQQETLYLSTQKQCSGCREVKSLEDFYSNYGHGHKYVRSKCKTCTSLNKPFYFRFTTYRLTREDFNLLLEQQKHKCAICQKLLNKAYVDHDHSCCPGKKSCGKCVRGLLCLQCNAGLSYIEDKEFRQKSIMYLKEYTS